MAAVPVIPELRRQKPKDGCELKTVLSYAASSRPASLHNVTLSRRAGGMGRGREGGRRGKKESCGVGCSSMACLAW